MWQKESFENFGWDINQYSCYEKKTLWSFHIILKNYNSYVIDTSTL